ncbi:MAG: YceI family protein [Pseudomonadota bacterium]
MRTIHFAAATALALASAPASAEPYVLDKSHAVISFTVDHLGFSSTKGVFQEFDAEISFDPEAVEDSSVRFVIQAASVNTFWPARDKHIRDADFLHVEEYPEIVFVSTKITPAGGETAKIEGDLTIRGETRPMVFEATLNKIGPSPFDPSKTIAGFDITGVIDRTDFGINYAAPAVGTEIPVTISLEMSPASS